MGVMSFEIPSDITPELADVLLRSSVGGGPDNMPWPTDTRVEPGLLTVRREVNESGFLLAPWDIKGFGRLMGATGTLIERTEPYSLTVELARGKVNQVRAQTVDLESDGIHLSPPLLAKIHDTSVAFSHAVSQHSSEQNGLAQSALESAYHAADELVKQAVAQELSQRHQRQRVLQAHIGCRLDSRDLPAAERALFTKSFTEASLLMPWNQVEATQGAFTWEPFDDLLSWAEGEKLSVVAGPLIDFTPSRLPDWLWLWRDDLTSIASFACDYVTAALKRYSKRIRTWELSSAANLAAILGLGEEELLWICARLVEAARHVDPGLNVVIGIAQPWGEYMSRDDRTHSPFIFADTLIRAGLSLAALDLEIVMGVAPRGSYARDLLELSRLLHLYSLLGAPLRVTLGYPSAKKLDPLADAELSIDAGYWPAGMQSSAQAEWARACAELALSKAYVQGVHWIHWSDAAAHQFPWCGIIDGSNQPKPALQELQALRSEHLS